MMESFTHKVFVIFDYLKHRRPDVINVKLVLAVAAALILVVVVKKIVDFCLWYRYYRKLMKHVPGPENTHWLYGNLHLVRMIFFFK